MLCVSIHVHVALLDLLSLALISCVNNRNLVGGEFLYLLLTSVKVFFGNNLRDVVFIVELSLHTMYPKQIKLQYISNFQRENTCFRESTTDLLMSFTLVDTTRKETVNMFYTAFAL